MRAVTATLLAIACAVAVANAQSKKQPKTITVSGCIERDKKTPEQFTITDKKAGKTYKLTGANLAEYLGRPVQVDGGIVVKGITIKGGLQPNPNVAAQGGAMDPSRAAVAAATGSVGTGNVDDIKEFRVKAVRPSAGSCE
jgi:hypothetical protein